METKLDPNPVWSNESSNDVHESFAGLDSFSERELQQLLLSSDPLQELESMQAMLLQQQIMGIGSADDVQLGSWGPRSGLELDLRAASQFNFYDVSPSLYFALLSHSQTSFRCSTSAEWDARPAAAPVARAVQRRQSNVLPVLGP